MLPQAQCRTNESWTHSVTIIIWSAGALPTNPMGRFSDASWVDCVAHTTLSLCFYSHRSLNGSTPKICNVARSFFPLKTFTTNWKPAWHFLILDLSKDSCICRKNNTKLFKHQRWCLNNLHHHGHYRVLWLNMVKFRQCLFPPDAAYLNTLMGRVFGVKSHYIHAKHQ